MGNELLNLSIMFYVFLCGWETTNPASLKYSLLKRKKFLSDSSFIWIPPGRCFVLPWLPAVELLHLLDGVGAGQALRGGRSGGPLPRGRPVHMIHEEDPAVAVDPSLPV